MRRRILLLVVGMTTLVVLAFSIPLSVLIRATVAQDARNNALAEAGRVTLFLRGYPAPSVTKIKTFVATRSKASELPISVTFPDGSREGATPVDSAGPSGGLPGYGANLPGGYGGSTSAGAGSGGAASSGAGTGTGESDDSGRGPQAQLHQEGGGQVAVAVAPSPDGIYIVRVYLSDDALHNGDGPRWLLLGGTALALIALGIIAGELLTRRIVRPLVQTAGTAQRLSAGDVTARAPTDGPVEVADVGRALNRLADRIDELIAEERETVADLSHRLRTPLTALRLDAEALRDPVDAERVGTHVSALERMLTAVIRSARRPQREGRMPSCNATTVVGERVAFWSALTEDQRRRGMIELPTDPLPVRAAAEDLAAALDALLENVIAHTPEGVDFAVRLEATADGARLTVADDGPGLPAGEPIRGRSDRGSSGLGLDIARRCAESSGGAMSLGSNPSGGAAIILELGAP